MKRPKRKAKQEPERHERRSEARGSDRPAGDADGAGGDRPASEADPAGEREERRRRRAEGQGKKRKRGGRVAAAKLISAFREGGRATREELGESPRSLVKRGVAGIIAAVRGLLAVVQGAGKLIGEALVRVAGPGTAFGRRLRSVLTATSGFLTPARGLLIAAVGCAVLLGLSQFADYRGVAIGIDNYDSEISSVAPAPEVDRAELGTAHAYLMVPAALIAIGILLYAARTRRWQLCRLAALIGLGALVVTLLIDRPAGLDEGPAARDFAGAEAQLLGGWWVQLFAGIGLVVTSLMLGAEIRRAGGSTERGGAGVGPRRRRSERPDGDADRRARDEASGRRRSTGRDRDSGQRRSRRRPGSGAGPDVEGAGA